MRILPRWCWIIGSLLAPACTTHRYLSVPIRQAEQEFKDHIGFVLYDPASQRNIYQHQGDRYFTPASNTKIFTLYASLQLLGDSIPALRYEVYGDSLIFWGTGDPGFLYRNCSSGGKAYNFLKDQTATLYFSSGNFKTDYFGPGWAWDDYAHAFQVERTSFPIYGNRATIQRRGAVFTSSPPVFELIIADSVRNGKKSTLTRKTDANQVIFTPGLNGRTREWEVPFRCSDDLLVKMLADTLKKEVRLTSGMPGIGSRVIYSIPSDSLYKVMMQESDNFIAEQLLLLCSNVVSDTLKPEIAIEHVKKKYLQDLPDEPVWVDGSGLSRYNLFTPRSIVRLWEKIYGIVARERLFSLLATGGESGAIRNSYNGTPRPYIVGKTGTLSNHYSLSGYLVTQRGRTLIFSWMNNNFASPNAQVRNRMETVLRNVYEKY